MVRSCDAFGVQEVHASAVVSEPTKRTKGGQSSAGSERWYVQSESTIVINVTYLFCRLHTRTWSSSSECLEHLRSRGYRIAAAVLSDRSVDLADLNLTEKTAFVFGNEYRGISNQTLETADVHFNIPMVGLAESLNVSVAAGATLYAARQTKVRCPQLKYTAEYRQPPLLEPEEAEVLALEWLLQTRFGNFADSKAVIIDDLLKQNPSSAGSADA